MITIKAKIKLYSGISKRKTAFTNGYRPLFDLIEQTKTSGMIALIDREEFKPGDEGVVDIKFLDARCFEGQQFFFYESEEPLGEGVVLEILDQTPRNK